MATDAWVLQALVDAKDEAVFALDRELRYLAFNRAHADGMRALYGAEIKLGGRLTDYQTVEADRSGAARTLELALAGERVVAAAYSGEEAHRRFYDLVHIPLVKDDEVIGVVVRTHDVTERTRAEQALRDNERALSTLLDNVPDVVFHVDREYRLVTANAAFSEAIAAAGGDPILPGDPVIPPEYPEEFKSLWKAHYDRALGGEPFVVETTVPRDDGTRTMENHLRPVLDGDGATTGIVVTSRDITERRRTEDVRAFLARTASRAGDEPFFEALARYLAASLGMDFVCIDRLDSDGLTAHTLAVWTDGRFEDNVSYALKDTPCGDVVGHAVCCFPEGVRRSFPDDEVLQELCAESYVGVTLFSHTGEPIGLIAVIGRKPLVDRRPAETLLELVAVRAASELERLDAEAELRQTHDRLDLALRASGAGIWDWGVVTGEIEWSPEMFTLFGLDAGVDAGFETWNKALHPDDLEGAHALIARALADHAPLDSEYRIVKPDGEVRWINAFGQGVYDERGDAVRMSGLCIDVSERRQVAAELRESEERHRSLFVSMAQGVVYQDSEGSIIAANPSAERILGLSLDQMQGRTSMDPRWRAIHEDGSDFPGDQHPAIVSLRTGREVSDVVMGVFNPTSGSYRWMTVNAAPQFRPGESKPSGVFATFDDVTERKQAEEELRETRDYLENLFGYANAPIVVWDAELRITRFNHAFEELTLRSADEVVGRHLELLFPEDERRAEALKHVTSATTGGERWQVVEIPILRADGEVRTVLWNSATVLGADGATPVATIAQGQDITARTLAEAEIKHLNTDLERRVAERTRDLSAANAELEEFVYSIAHDLRSPLRSLSGFSQIVEHDYEEVIDETGRDYLRRIRDAAGHLGDLMDALLSLSQIGRRKLDLHDVDLSALAREVAEALHDADPERQADFEIEEGLVAKGDAALCEIVVQNLIGNAWKFSAGETPALIRFGAERRDGRRVFCVSDNGVGFDPEYAGKLFAPFERLHTADQFPGTGIGLATVRRAVTRLGGDCWADAEEGGGARLYFTLEEPG